MAVVAASLAHGGLGLGRHRRVEGLEAVPGDGALEGVVEDAGGGQRLAQIGRLDEGLAPGALSAGPVVALVGLEFAFVVGAAFERAGEPGLDRMVGGFEVQHQEVEGAVARAGDLGLVAVHQAAVRGIEPGLGDRAHGGDRVLEGGEAHRAGGPVGGPVLKPHPGFGDDAEGALGADQQAVGARPRAGARQAARFEHPLRGHRTQAFDEVVDMGVEGGEMPARAGRDPAAQGGMREGLREVPERQPVGLQLRLQHRAEGARLDARRAARPVDLQHPVHGLQVQADGAGEVVAHVGLDPADDARAAAVGHHRDPRPRGPVEHADDVLLGARMEHEVGRVRHLPGEHARAVRKRLAVGVAEPRMHAGIGDGRERVGDGNAGARQVELVLARHRPKRRHLAPETGGERRHGLLLGRRVEPFAFQAPAPELGARRHG